MNRSGVVLVLVLLAILALELLAMSAFGFARVAQLSARMAGIDAALQAAAGDAAEQAAGAIDVRTATARPVGTEWSAAVSAPPGMSVTAVLRRLDAGYVLVTASASQTGFGAVRAAALVRIIEPAAVIAAFPAVLSAFGIAGPDPAITSPPQAECATDGGFAPPALPLLARRAFADSLPLGSAVAAGWADVARIADARVLPARDSGRAALIVLDGPVALADTVTGVLVVDGDLVLAPGALVRGLLAVHGTLILATGARIAGAARVGAFVDDGGRIVYDRCAIEVALTAPALRRAYRHGQRWRLPTF